MNGSLFPHRFGTKIGKNRATRMGRFPSSELAPAGFAPKIKAGHAILSDATANGPPLATNRFHERRAEMADELKELSAVERQFLAEAADYLENPRFLLRAANLVGKPAEALLARLPQSVQGTVAHASQAALETALEWALRTLPDAARATPSENSEKPPARGAKKHLHTALAATTGAVGGFFGLPGMTVEVPATTLVMLRSIAAIAAEEGFALDDPDTRLHCLAVLSFGAENLSAMDSTYLASRLGLALALRDAGKFLAAHSAAEVAQAISKGTAPVLVRLMNAIAARFQIVLTQKAAAQSVPVAGAATGAVINAAFTDHFNRVARYHFGILRLENQHGKDAVQAAYARAAEQHRVGGSQEG